MPSGEQYSDESKSQTVPPTSELSKRKLVVITIAGTLLWGAGVMQIVGVGFLLPTIGHDFGMSPSQTQWVSTDSQQKRCVRLVEGVRGESDEGVH